MKNKVILRFIIPPALIIAFAIYVIVSLSTKNSSLPPPSGWVLQTDLQSQLRGRTLQDMTFTDSVTGYAVSSKLTLSDTGFIFKTTNGGDNWIVNYFSTGYYFRKISFVRDSIGYAVGGTGGGFSCVYKTINKGSSWFSLNLSGASLLKSISFLNKDTVYVCDDDGLVGGVFRTTNGGQNWERIWFAGQYNPQAIYMYNARIGFYAQGDLWKTTDGGFNWTIINNRGFVDIKFFDSLTGYKSYADSTGFGRVQKTTNGGFNWIVQPIPIYPGEIMSKDLTKVYFIGIDTFFAVGTFVEFQNPIRRRGLIYKTTNGGINWGYQLPDTHLIQISRYDLISFAGNKHGWIYNGNYNPGKGFGIHTTIGGDTTFYTNIKEQITNVSSGYILYQNFPNPFNAITKIKYTLKKSEVRSQKSEVRIVVYDILGREKIILVNEKKSPGDYDVKFDGNNLPTGIYFYTLFVDNQRIDTKKLLLIK